MPLFSVIIPSYNRERLIGPTIDSILAQDRPDAEIIVVDDGSTDRTREVVGGYGSKVTLLTQANKGPGAARNLGLTIARGEYVAYLDSDDLWFPWAARVYTQLIERHTKPSFIAGKPFIFTDVAAIGSVREGELNADYYADFYRTSFGWLWFSASSFVIRTEVLRSVGGMINRWINAEDADLTMRLGVSPGFVHINQPCTFAWRSHAGSAVSSHVKNFEGVMNLLETEAANGYPGGNARALERRELITRPARAHSFECLRAKDRARAWTLYRRAFAWHLRQARLKYLLGFPVAAGASMFR